MSRRQILIASLLAILSQVPRAEAGGKGVEIDPRFPAAVDGRVGNQTVRLVLTGTALRTKLRFRVYAVASYVQEGLAVRAPEQLAGLDAPKQLHLIFERDVDGATMAKAYRESIGKSFPAPAFSAELANVERHFLANPINRGDHVRLIHVPGVGLGVQVNAQPVMMVGGVDFARAAWGTYFGPNHLGVALKSGLSSRL